jgi:hypothetical protein
MRLISTSPEFSLAGTGAILIITTLFGTWAGLAFVARRRGWQGWKHYVPRGLAVIFFLPFGIAGGLPLMLTVLIATLGLVQRAIVGLWVLAGLVLLVAFGTDIVIPTLITIIAPVSALALTVWTWALQRWHTNSLLTIDRWLERVGRAFLLLLAAYGVWTVVSGILTDKPSVLGVVAVVVYPILLFPLFLALRVGLQPRPQTSA